MSQDPTFLHLVGLLYQSGRPMRWVHHPNVHGRCLGHLPFMVAIPGTTPAVVATTLWPHACLVRPKLSIKGAVFTPAVGQVPAVEPRGSVSDFLVGYAALVTSCDSSSWATPYSRRYPIRRNHRAQVPLHIYILMYLLYFFTFSLQQKIKICRMYILFHIYFENI